VLVTQVLPGTPAERAGLQPLDQIVRVDGHGLASLSMAEVIARISGAPGSKVTLVVERAGHSREVTLTRALLGGQLNAAVRDRRVARRVRRLQRALGGAVRLAAVEQLHVEATGAGSTHYLDAARAGFRSLTCSATGLVTVFGHDGRRAWGAAPPGVNVDETARAMMERPHAGLASLAVLDFLDPARPLAYKGRIKLAPPAWLPFRVPRAAVRFELGGETLDFDPRSGLLVHQLDGSGYPVFYGDYRRVAGIMVPGRRTSGQRVLALRVSFTPIPAQRFQARGALHCDP
jgi:hypothetical protein